MGHALKVAPLLRSGTRVFDPRKIAILYLCMVLVISAISVIGIMAVGFLALLEDILLEMLIAVTFANFSLWIWFHSSYFERVKAAENAENQAVRKLMRQIQESPKLTDSELERWLRHVSDRYWRRGDLRISMDLTIDGFRWGGIIGLIGLVFEIISTLMGSTIPTTPTSFDIRFVPTIVAWGGLFFSTFTMLLAIYAGNRLMHELSSSRV